MAALYLQEERTVPAAGRGQEVCMKGTDRYAVEGVSCRIGAEPFVVVNLSVGGLFLAHQGVFPVLAQDLPMELELPGIGALSMVGRVSWHNNPEQPRMPSLPPGFGAKIVRVGFTEKMSLLRYLREVDPVAMRRPPALPR